MRATVFVDVLSHWCLAAMPAAQALHDLIPDFEIAFAPLKDGEALGFTKEMETWFYERGARAYGRTLVSAWCESPQTRTWFANAAALVGGELTKQPLRIAHAVMSGAMEQGGLFGRADQVYGYVASIAGVRASEIARLAAEPRIAEALREANRRLAASGADERPTFLLENVNGDRVLLKGVWHKEAVVSSAMALLHDERAYAAAGAPPL